MTSFWQLIMEEPQNYLWVIAITGLGHEEMINGFFKFHFVGILRNSRLFRTKITFDFTKRFPDNQPSV